MVTGPTWGVWTCLSLVFVFSGCLIWSLKVSGPLEPATWQLEGHLAAKTMAKCNVLDLLQSNLVWRLIEH